MSEHCYRHEGSHFEISLVVLLFLISLTTCDCVVALQHPTDNVLLDNFRAHEEDFNTLIKMANEDSHVVRIASDFTWLDSNYNWPRPEAEPGFSKERWEKYRSLFKVLQLEEDTSAV